MGVFVFVCGNSKVLFGIMVKRPNARRDDQGVAAEPKRRVRILRVERLSSMQGGIIAPRSLDMLAAPWLCTMLNGLSVGRQKEVVLQIARARWVRERRVIKGS
jgi:hypothetical protein